MSTSTYAKPLPVIDALNRPFWEAARAHEIRLPRCGACGNVRAQFERWCPRCTSDRFTWERMSGRGRVWTFCWFHRPYFAAFAPDLPYNVAMVELEEGPRLVTNIVEVGHADLRVGLPVTAVFDAVTPEVTLVKFRPAQP